MSLGAVHQHEVEVKFLCQADGGEDVVGAVAVDVGFEFPGDDRHQRLTFGVEVRRIGVLILLRFAAVLVIALGLSELLANQGSGGHAGHRGLGFVVVAALGIFSKRKFHRDRRLEHHAVDVVAKSFDGAELAADGVCAARPGDHGGDGGIHRLGKALVERVDGVDAAQVRGDRVGHLVEVVALKVQPFLGQPHVAVGVDKARIDGFACEVVHLLRGKIRQRGALGHRPQILDAAVLCQQKAVLNCQEPCRGGLHGHQVSVDKKHGKPPITVTCKIIGSIILQILIFANPEIVSFFAFRY